MCLGLSLITGKRDITIFQNLFSSFLEYEILTPPPVVNFVLWLEILGYFPQYMGTEVYRASAGV